MAPLIALGIKLFLPVLVAEAQKKIAREEYPTRATAVDIPVEVAAPVAAKAAVRSLKNSKTVVFSVVLGILGVLEAHADVLTPLLGNKWGWVLVGIGGASAILRTMTTASLLDKE